MESKICNICNGTEIHSKYLKHGISIMECKRCELCFVYPIPSVEKQKKYYDEHYQNGRYKTYQNAHELRMKLNEKRFEEIRKYNPEGNHLDIGCATGIFLDVAHKNGLTVYGTELSKEAVTNAKKHHKNIFNGIVEQANYPSEFFELVTIYDLIEHVLDPDQTFREVNRIMKKNGLVVITTPDLKSWHAKILGRHFYQIDPFQHLFYFSPKSIRKIMEKNGFEIIEIKKNLKIFTLEEIFNMSATYYPLINKILSKIIHILPKKILKREKEFFFGEMFVVAKKNKNVEI